MVASNSRIRTACAGVVTARSQGETVVSLTNGNGTVQLNCAIHVPEITHNFLSVFSLCDADRTVLFKKDRFLVKKGSKVIVYEKRDEGMYSIVIEK